MTRLQASRAKLLKKDVFGEVRLCTGEREPVIVRDAGAARPWLRWLARWLLRREARALQGLDGMTGVPELRHVGPDSLERSYIPGSPLQEARPVDREYFDQAARLLRRMHRLGVVHNDLAKEPNLLVDAGGNPAIIDFQLAWRDARRGRIFRLMAREDLRHLLKHKRHYCPERLTAREKRLLAAPSGLARAWRWTLHPLGRRLRRWLTPAG